MTGTEKNLPLLKAGSVYDPRAMKAARSARIETTLRQFVTSKGEAWEANPLRTWAADFLGDFKHWCDLNSVSFERAEQLADSHHRAECEDDQDSMLVSVANSLPPIMPH